MEGKENGQNKDQKVFSRGPFPKVGFLGWISPRTINILVILMTISITMVKSVRKMCVNDIRRDWMLKKHCFGGRA